MGGVGSAEKPDQVLSPPERLLDISASALRPCALPVPRSDHAYRARCAKPISGRGTIELSVVVVTVLVVVIVMVVEVVVVVTVGWWW